MSLYTSLRRHSTTCCSLREGGTKTTLTATAPTVMNQMKWIHSKDEKKLNLNKIWSWREQTGLHLCSTKITFQNSMQPNIRTVVNRREIQSKGLNNNALKRMTGIEEREEGRPEGLEGHCRRCTCARIGRGSGPPWPQADVGPSEIPVSGIQNTPAKKNHDLDSKFCIFHSSQGFF